MDDEINMFNHYPSGVSGSPRPQSERQLYPAPDFGQPDNEQEAYYG